VVGRHGHRLDPFHCDLTLSAQVRGTGKFSYA
jgi:hypothetical protein